MKTQPSYVRCIKSNEEKRSDLFDKGPVTHQIKYLGLLENIRVRRAGFCHRQVFEKFLDHFYLLSRRTGYAGNYIWNGDAKTGCRYILQDAGIHPDEWQLGNTKVFIRHPGELLPFIRNNHLTSFVCFDKNKRSCINLHSLNQLVVT
jgi:myosin-1